MARNCNLQRPGWSGAAEWRLAEDLLTFSSPGTPAFVVPIAELRGIGGDEYEIHLVADGGDVVLTKLGGEGGRLFSDLNKAWFSLRTEALRLAGSSDTGIVFQGACVLPGATDLLLATLAIHKDLLIISPRGSDLVPLFYGHIADITFDQDTYVVDIRLWDGRNLKIGKLAGQTEEFVTALSSSRTALASRGAELLAKQMASLPTLLRAELAGLWPPGRLVPLYELDGFATGFAKSFVEAWLPSLPRKAEGKALLAWANAKNLWLGYSIAAPGPNRDTEETDEGAFETTPEETSNASGDEKKDQDPINEGGVAAILWLLARSGNNWVFEALSHTDHATYCFTSKDNMTTSVACALAAPQFSLEALYLPFDKLRGDRSELAIAARDLPFLSQLRTAFRRRIVHTSAHLWQQELTTIH